ncbi:MAG: hypothetical protein AUI53_05810 [Acidobacteria bacterium 13_1_40CM_2_60_7]|nr:MAG: hypothetical protein AUI53_05810 [Acidobacteria bacterium 13_1_40CM_2_60_7]OLE85302.1 MAG: hypothetical protein AUG07_04815 [Acidobacteria bacterium 13_1_20CM_2_60_10]
MSQTNGFWKVVPPTAKIIAAISYVGFGLLMRFAMLPTDPDMRQWLDWQKDLFSAGVPLVVPLYVLVVGYVYGDAKRRGMRRVMWTILACLPYFVGVIAYFILRDPLPRPCPNCQTVVRAAFPFCPKCGTSVTRFCSQCRHAAEPTWAHCPYCGANLAAGLPTTAGPGE